MKVAWYIFKHNLAEYLYLQTRQFTRLQRRVVNHLPKSLQSLSRNVTFNTLVKAR